MDQSTTIIALVTATFFVAGIVKGVTGMGLPTVAMGVLGAFMSPLSAASLLLMPSFVTNIWQLVTGPNFAALMVRLWPMMSGIVVGTVAGAGLLTSVNTAWTTAALGAALAAYALLALLAPPFSVPARIERWASPLVGLVTGLVTGGTGVFVIPAVPYLQSLGLGRDDLIQALGLSFTISTIALGLGLSGSGAFHATSILSSMLAIVPALAGMWFGTAIRGRISPPAFRRWFLICLVLLGLDLLLRPLL
ncbi:sulfite exporter TauE/SafE family protein [Bradyrhizobium sp. NP1]|uniref:sulfite exporter TauE/SafE family protein n=1 Tax=Bradyrhizobium sp. NP1 TaxID=3049772 RepID=UPI0025A63D78|nr:sulfite exporter TauE/SafE family protein [Bradyrhizobium sp. NP1]WJR77993.1 sulfite exporter TauE/SafE family protein [Bradyrhizobium sp. NP1]